MPTAQDALQHDALQRALSTALVFLLLVTGASVAGCDSGGSSSEATGPDTTRVTASLDGELSVESTPSSHRVNYTVAETDENALENGEDATNGFSFTAPTPIDVPNIDEITTVEGGDPPGFDRYQVTVQSSDPQESLDSITLLNGDQEVATADTPAGDSPDSLSKTYVIIVTSP
ncbi:hypothetical protein [Salinibacter ruber]|uniref:Uncharacterized protein n=1 Tax=Salinibacter ruber TaxID=146919 RepID=A0A9X2UN78_9BACT|nr:hypothetical protein [Salinibacter ruber]MCS3613509.1 hypothetical protein [Salinibacter ruber]MCS3616454.1 hypothetical protein [Salinibacter ruber]MCS3648272.1 hypothetical protein [Salinibacter ruber]MCS3785807.1 hypothetical protein [Salinibacter ruber]MCS4037986.1 hypothetical protein [Salinibacter ruber]